MKVKVHLLEFYGICNTHTEIVLETTHNNDKYYYMLNRWSDADDKFTLNHHECTRALKNANRTITLEIEADLLSLIKDCKNYLNSKEGDLFTNNCGDTSAWFLAEYTNIQNPGPTAKPVTCNQAWCCFFVPSFAQGCLPTLPGRVMDYTEYQLKQRNENEIAPRLKMHAE